MTASALKVSDNRQAIHPTWLIILTSIWLATVGNLSLWKEIIKLPETNDIRALWFGISFALLIASLLCIVLSLLCWRWTLKPVFSVFLLLSAVGSYFMLSYGVVIDTTMIVNVLQTDLRESLDLISWKMLFAVTLFAIMPIIWVWRSQIKHLPVLGQLAHNTLLFVGGCILCVIAVLPIYQDFSSTMRNNAQLRFLINPLNSIYALGELALQPLRRTTSEIQPIGLDAKLSSSYIKQTKVPLLVLVVGETARSNNFGINGYPRDTTPALTKLQSNIDGSGDLINYQNVWSCGTTTAVSLPCMFSHLGKSAFDDSTQTYENLIDVLQRAGLAVIWMENQSGCKGVCDRIPRVATGGLNQPSFCSTGECFDEVMLQQLTERMAALPPERIDKGIVVVLHQMGSHGPAYYKRAPENFKKFQPECTTNVLQDCTREEINNAYDNSVLYTDYFLNTVVNFLKAKKSYAQTAMLYVGDHGESLGEKNLYLHGLPYAIAPDVQKRIPWISWLSSDFSQRSGVETACLKQQTNQRLSHDNYFHSILGLMDIQTSLYKPALDVYSSCRLKSVS